MRENCKYSGIKFYTQINYLSGARMEKILSCIDYIPYPDSSTETDDSIAKKFLIKSKLGELHMQTNEEDQDV